MNNLDDDDDDDNVLATPENINHYSYSLTYASKYGSWRYLPDDLIDLIQRALTPELIKLKLDCDSWSTRLHNLTYDVTRLVLDNLTSTKLS